MPHPYTEEELDAGTWTEHTGTCGACYPVDPQNPTPSESKARSECPHCLGSGEHRARLMDTNGLVGLCDECGNNTMKTTRHVKGDGAAPRAILICRNCLVQNHHDACKDCSAGWLEGA